MYTIASKVDDTTRGEGYWDPPSISSKIKCIVRKKKLSNNCDKLETRTLKRLYHTTFGFEFLEFTIVLNFKRGLSCRQMEKNHKLLLNLFPGVWCVPKRRCPVYLRLFTQSNTRNLFENY